MTLITAAAIASIVAAVTSVITLVIEHRPGWHPNWTRLRKILLAAGFGVVVGGAVGVGLYFGLSNVNQGSTNAGPSSNPTKTPTSGSSSTSAGTSTPSPSRALTPITFKVPHPGQQEGKVITVLLKGDVPNGRHLWIFVKSSGMYYVQGTPTPEPPNYWSLAGVNLGDNHQSDINMPYTIYAIEANAKANSAIERDFHRTHGNTGTSTIPGGVTVKGAPNVTVIRNR